MSEYVYAAGCVHRSEREVAPVEHGGVGEQPNEVLLVRQERPPALRGTAALITVDVIAPGVGTTTGGGGGSAGGTLHGTSPLVVPAPGRPAGGGGGGGAQEDELLLAVALAPPDDEAGPPPEHGPRGAALLAPRRARGGRRRPPGGPGAEHLRRHRVEVVDIVARGRWRWRRRRILVHQQEPSQRHPRGGRLRLRGRSSPRRGPRPAEDWVQQRRTHTPATAAAAAACG